MLSTCTVCTPFLNISSCKSKSINKNIHFPGASKQHKNVSIKQFKCRRNSIAIAEGGLGEDLLKEDNAGVRSRRNALLSSSLGVAGSWAMGAASPWTNALAAEESGGAALPLVLPGQSFGQVSSITPSSVIKGCWQLSGGHKGDRETDRTSGAAAVEDFQKFVDAGIYTFDTGPEECGYGPSEKIIGEYLKKTEDPKIQVFTKLCCVGSEMYDLKPDFVKSRMARARARLGVKKLDVVQFYWNDYGSSAYVDAALYLQDEVAAGRVGHVALTNFDTARMQAMWDKGVKISANQIQYSLLDRRPESRMVEFCKQYNVALLPYGVMAGGLLSKKFLDIDVSQAKANTSSLGKYSSVLRKVGSWDWLQLLLKTLDGVASKHNVSIADVATKWVLEKGCVPAVIIGARNANHVDDHRRLGTFKLDQSDNEDILAVLKQGKQPRSDCYGWERGISEF